MQRLDTLRQNSPFHGKTFSYIRTPTRKTAFLIEGDLLEKFKPWRTRGEWIQFGAEDNWAFNAVLNEKINPYRTAAYPMRWTQLDVREINKQKAASKIAFNRYYAKLGTAKKDAMRDSRGG